MNRYEDGITSINAQSNDHTYEGDDDESEDESLLGQPTRSTVRAHPQSSRSAYSLSRLRAFGISVSARALKSGQ